MNHKICYDPVFDSSMSGKAALYSIAELYI